MTPERVRDRATELLAQLEKLDERATSQQQRRAFKDARAYLERARSEGEVAPLQLGSYWLAALTQHVEEVERSKRPKRKPDG